MGKEAAGSPVCPASAGALGTGGSSRGAGGWVGMRWELPPPPPPLLCTSCRRR